MDSIDETYNKTIELYELPETHIKVLVDFRSDFTEHEELDASLLLNGAILADNLDSVLFMLLESSNDEMKRIGADLELWLEEMRKEATSSYREELEIQARQEELDDLNAEYWATR